MRFRPCIDIHNGKVKQIVGGSLSDKGSVAAETFSSEKEASYYAKMYREMGLFGGHVILLNPEGSQYYEATKMQALDALRQGEGSLQVGGGISDQNAAEFLDAGASHVIVTSFVFKNGLINYENLNRLVSAIGSDRLVLDLSCKKKDGDFYIVTDRWQKMTDTKLDEQTLSSLSSYCDEFLIHAADVEGKQNGIEKQVAELLGNYCTIPVTYAGGVHSIEDIELLKKLGKEKVDITVGSALKIFGGSMEIEDIIEAVR